MPLSVGEAAKLVGLTRQALHAAIKKGALSATPTGPKGSFQIDPAELFRVYQPVKQDPSNESDDLTSLVTRKDAEIHDLTVKLKAAHELLDVLRSQVDDLKEQRDLWQVEARIWQQKALPAPEPKRGFFAKLFGSVIFSLNTV